MGIARNWLWPACVPGDIFNSCLLCVLLAARPIAQSPLVFGFFKKVIQLILWLVFASVCLF